MISTNHPVHDHNHPVQVIDLSRKRLKRADDGTPWEVALSQGLDHPNIVRIMHHIIIEPEVGLPARFLGVPAGRLALVCTSWG